jgi:nitrate/TMAO reductase-like tetraheme cytochrome c subunit
MKKCAFHSICLALFLLATSAFAASREHPGKEYLEKNGYHGPETCEECHTGKAKEFLTTVHWKHSSKISNVEGLDPNKEYGMLNRIYTMCNGNDIVNNLKEIPKNAAGKAKFSGCNTCHPGNHLSGVGSSGPEAEKAVDCLVCHSTDYDFRERKPFKDEQGRVVMGQDRSTKAALSIGKPTVKNCMVCHESAGGGVLIKRGFAFNKETDVHAAKGMVCVDCHKAKNHRMPTGFDPNNWANDGLRLSCVDCHGEAPHKDADYNRHTARIACQTCHIPRTGGALAKDFTKWEQGADKFFEPTTLRKEANETVPVYAWYNKTVASRNKARQML